VLFFFVNSVVSCFCSDRTDKQQRKSKQTNIHARNKKINEEKHIWKRAERDHVRKKGKKKNSEADSFRHMEIKIHYTPEDVHVGRNM
jgi:cell wall assembly regulator SMI1